LYFGKQSRAAQGTAMNKLKITKTNDPFQHTHAREFTRKDDDGERNKKEYEMKANQEKYSGGRAG